MELWDRALDAHKNGRLAEAEELYRAQIAKDPRHFDSLHMLGIVCYENGKPLEAEQFFLRALAVDANYPPAFHNYGLLLGRLKRYPEAIEQFDKALKIFDKFAPAYSDRGISLMELGRLDEALDSHNKAVALAPNVPMAVYNRANTLFRKRDYAPAMADYDKAIALRGDYADAYCGRGNVLRELGRPAEALAAYDRALALAPDLAEARLGRGNLYRDSARHDQAFEDYNRALVAKPDLPGVEGDRLLAKLHLCDWSGIGDERARLITAVRSGQPSSSPFPFLVVSSSPEDQLNCAKVWNGSSASAQPTWQGPQYQHDRIRLGYVSADFRQHAVASLAAGMFECHDKSRFDVTAFSIGPQDNSDLGRRVKGAFEHFVDAGQASDDEIGKRIKDAEIDILVDLMGFTAGARTSVFARRPAPIQVNYLGFLGTMGATFIDYMIADRIVVPESEKQFYAEKIVYLPNSFMPGDNKQRASDKVYTRADAGLPPQGFVFCCFNNTYKITPHVFESWMRILGTVDDSVLWLFLENPTVERNLRREAEARGIAAERLIAAPRVPLAEHRARMVLADLFLDTSPYNAGATASDALWAGLPVLTCIGETVVGRMAASMLSAIGLPELIARTARDYEALACMYGSQPAKLADIRRKLVPNRSTTPLFNTPTFTLHLEQAYREMLRRHQHGEPPESFAAAPM